MTDIIKSVAEAMQAVDGDFPMSIEAYEPFAEAAIEAYERVQTMNTSEKHVQKQAENEHIREITMEEITKIMLDAIGFYNNRGAVDYHLADGVAKALAKLGTIRIVGDV